MPERPNINLAEIASGLLKDRLDEAGVPPASPEKKKESEQATKGPEEAGEKHSDIPTANVVGAESGVPAANVEVLDDETPQADVSESGTKKGGADKSGQPKRPEKKENLNLLYRAGEGGVAVSKLTNAPGSSESLDEAKLRERRETEVAAKKAAVEKAAKEKAEAEEAARQAAKEGRKLKRKEKSGKKKKKGKEKSAKSQDVEPTEDHPKTRLEREHFSEDYYTKKKQELVKAEQKIDEYKKNIAATENPQTKAYYREKLTSVEQKYASVRAEYVGTSAVRALELRNDAAAKRFWELAQKPEKRGLAKTFEGISNVVEKAGQWHKGLGRWKRIGLGVGLGAAGLLTGGAGWGAGLLLTKRGFSALGTGVGTYELMLARLKNKDVRAVKEIADDKQAKLDQLNEAMTIMTVRAQLDGKSVEDLQNDPIYQDLQKRAVAALEKRQRSNKYAELLLQDIANAEKAIDEQFKSQKKKVNYWKGIAVATSLIWSSGLLTEGVGRAVRGISNWWDSTEIVPSAGASGSSEVLSMQAAKGVEKAAQKAVEEGAGQASDIEVRDFNKPEVPGDAEPSIQNLQAPERDTEKPMLDDVQENVPQAITLEVLQEGKLMHNGVDTKGSYFVDQQQNLHVGAGHRGIEGALQDIKTDNPEQHKKFVEWLSDKENGYFKDSPGADNSDGALIHRFVMDKAPEGGDINKITSGEIVIGKDGVPSFGEVAFQKVETAASSASESAQPHGLAERVKSTDFDYESSGDELDQALNDLAGDMSNKLNEHFDTGAVDTVAGTEHSLSGDIAGGSEDIPQWQWQGVDQGRLLGDAPKQFAEAAAKEAEENLQNVGDVLEYEATSKIAGKIGEEAAKKFLADLGLGASETNALATQNLSEFMARIDPEKTGDATKRFYKLYDTLFETVKLRLDKMWTREEVRKLTVFEALLEAAKDYRNSSL